MAAAKHLSIGEVLVLLQEDFPDVTISKIRFLESQGLLDPDRTPSGYRKFYDADIAKLRWILRQQREHFLPLKVIKERLEESGGVLPDDADVIDDAPDDAAIDAVDDELDLSAYLEDEEEGGTLFGAGTGIQEDDSDGAVDEPEEADEPDEEPTPEEEPVAKQAAPEPSGARGGRGRKRGRKREPDAPKPADVPAAKPEPAASVPRSAPVAAKQKRTVEPAPTRDTSPLDSGPTDVTLTPEELAAAAGLSQRQLGELVAYGLLGAPGVAGLPCYDGDDLVVARVAAGFLAHGVEARHLKRWKAAAQAEAGIYEQVIMPALRNRDSEQRVHAREVLAELVELGDQLRGALLRETLRDHLA